MLTDEQIQQNKIRFLTLISEITIPDADTEGLVNFLDNGDFFTAPASTLYHCNYKGGLCEHSLHVYDNLKLLITQYSYEEVYSEDTIKIVALLHDISKTNFYESYVKNEKVYDSRGSKQDNLGRFDWFAKDMYKVKDASERFLGGEHGFNSLTLLQQYIPLTYEESLAVMHHHCGFGETKQLGDLSAILCKYPLITLLHTADFLSTFIIEKDSCVK